MKVTDVQFTEWKTCNPADGSKLYLKLNLQPYQGGTTIVPGLGGEIAANVAEGTVTSPTRSVDLGLQALPGSDERSVDESIVVHEFGHVLGYQHEQDQAAAVSDTDYGYGGRGNTCSPTGDWNPDAAADAFILAPQRYNDDLVTTYDPDSIMNYCHTGGREYSGRLSILDIAGVQASTEYGLPALLDQDGDAINDRVDNCPYVANGFQENSNGPAELVVQLANPSGWNTCMSIEDGHIPIGTDPDCYVAHWHLAYPGDACDPTASTAVTEERVQSKVETHVCTVSSPCYDQILPSGPKIAVTSGTHPVSLSTGLKFDSHIGGPAAMALPYTVGARAAPTFCACTAGNTTACQRFPSNCILGDDNAFPYNMTFDPSGFKQISMETTSGGCGGSWCALNPFVFVSVTHVDPAPGYDSNTVHKTWDFINDLALFHMVAGSNNLQGVGWEHETGFLYSIQNRQQWYPIDGGTVAQRTANSVKNLSNSYWIDTARWDAIVDHVALPLPPLALPWFRVPYCDPTWDTTWGEPVEHEAVPYMTAVSLNGTFSAPTLNASGMFDLTPSFSANAQGLLVSLTSGNEILVADDRVGGQPRNAVGFNAIVVNAGTPRIVGAISDTGAGMDATYAAAVVGNGQATLRSFSATNQALYWLGNTGVWQLNTRLLPTALGGNPAFTTVTMSGVPLQSPRSIAYNRVSNTLFVVDLVATAGGSAIRLLSVSLTSGVATELWTTAPVGTAPTLYVSTTAEGEAIISATQSGGATDVLLTNVRGRPLGSYSIGGALQSGVVGHGSGITLPLLQTPTDSTPNVLLSFVKRSALNYGVCSSALFKAVANRNGGTGALADGPSCP